MGLQLISDQENPNVVQVRQRQRDTLPSQPLTPWPLALTQLLGG
ncbi:hypothetical protein [Shewanella sp. VB17]|nr:hypothetical protein [Shewanella sp. VB17]